MLLLDQIFCDKWKLRYNESRVIFSRADSCHLFEWIADKIINQNRCMFGCTQDSMHKIYMCCHKIAGQIEILLC